MLSASNIVCLWLFEQVPGQGAVWQIPGCVQWALDLQRDDQLCTKLSHHSVLHNTAHRETTFTPNNRDHFRTHWRIYLGSRLRNSLKKIFTSNSREMLMIL